MIKRITNLLIVSCMISISLALLAGCKKKDFDLKFVSIESFEAGNVSLSLSNNISIPVMGTLVDRNSYVKNFNVGFCWALHPSPTISDNVWNISCNNSGTISHTIEHLLQDTLYYVRLFVRNESEVIYSDEISFTTPVQYEKGVGEEFQGGVIAYIFQPGEPTYVENEFHGLIVAPYDQGSEIRWAGWGGANGTLITSMELGSGAQNTTNIVNFYSASSPDYAAKTCNDLVLNGYSDWFLPSVSELVKILEHREETGVFSSGWYDEYWSSSENNNANHAYLVQANDGDVYDISPFDYKRVRAVRQF